MAADPCGAVTEHGPSASGGGPSGTLTRLSTDPKEGPRHADIRATFRLTAGEYRSASRNSPALRVVWIISALMVALGLICLLVEIPSTDDVAVLGKARRHGRDQAAARQI